MDAHDEYTCAKCSNERSFLHINNLLTHVAVYHSHEPQFSYACNIDSGNCCKIVRSITALKLHVYREHRDHLLLSEHKNIVRSSGSKICCPVCAEVVDTLSDLSGHYRQHCDYGQSIYCVVEGCSAKFQVYSSYTSHMSRCHKGSADVDASHQQSSNAETARMQEESEFDTGGETYDENTYTKHLGLFLLKLQEDCLLSSSTIQTILDGFKELTSLLINSIQQTVVNICQDSNISSDVSSQILTTVNGEMLTTAFTELSSDWKRKQFYKNEYNFVEPQTVRYNVESSVFTSTFQYIPLQDSLKALLTNKKLSSQLLQQVPKRPNILSSFSDGTVYQEHPVYQNHPQALEIILYADEFDVVNPLGVHASVHKLLVFYYTVANIDRHLQSKKDTIQVVAICKSSDIKVYGMTAVANAILSDVKLLELQGIAVSGVPQRVYGTTAFIDGDNLNSHMIVYNTKQQNHCV